MAKSAPTKFFFKATGLVIHLSQRVRRAKTELATSLTLQCQPEPPAIGIVWHQRKREKVGILCLEGNCLDRHESQSCLIKVAHKASERRRLTLSTLRLSAACKFAFSIKAIFFSGARVRIPLKSHFNYINFRILGCQGIPPRLPRSLEIILGNRVIVEFHGTLLFL